MNYTERVSGNAVFVTLVRHGESEANREKRWQGQTDSPLSALGQEQARTLRARLAPERFRRVVTSDLRRARDTAGALGVALETTEALREFDVGRWEGLTQEEVARQFPEELDGLKRGKDVRLGGGESMSLFRARVGRAYRDLLASLEPGDHALIVAHGGVIASILAGALGFSRGKDWVLSRPANASVSSLAHRPSRVDLEVFNDTLHLAPLGGFAPLAGMDGLIALVCDQAGADSFGPFGASYELERDFAGAPERLDALEAALDQLEAKHAATRVQLRADGRLIHDWVRRLMWPHGNESGAELRGPLSASLAHVGRSQGRRLVFDYGVVALPAESADEAPSKSSV